MGDLEKQEKQWPARGVHPLNWGIGLMLYTWFNPHEPFLWLLEFLPFLVVFLGNGLKKSGNNVWILISIGILFLLIHNVLFFYLPYRIYG